MRKPSYRLLSGVGAVFFVLTALFTSLLTSLLTSPGFAQQKDTSPEHIFLQAEKITYLENPPLTKAEGNIRIQFKDITLYAEQIKLNLNTTEAQTEGKVRLNFDSYRLKGENLSINLREKEGFIENLQGEDSRAIFYSKKAHFSSHKLELRKGKFTTCKLSSPHYHIKAKVIEIYPGEKIVIRNATFYLGSVPLFWTPVYVYNLTQTNAPVLPTPGYSKYTGWYLKTGYLFYPFDNMQGTVNLDYYQKKGWGGGVSITYESEKDKGNLRTYHIKERDTGQIRGGGKIRYLGYILPTSLLKVNVNYITDEDFSEDYLYPFPEESEEEDFPSFASLEVTEEDMRAFVEVQKRMSPTQHYPELLPGIQLNIKYPSTFIRGAYATQNTEFANLKSDAAHLTRISSSFDLSYPTTILRYIRFKPALGGQVSVYKQSGEKANSYTSGYQSCEFSFSLKGKREPLTHKMFSNLKWYSSTNSHSPTLESAEQNIKQENKLSWRVQNKFFLHTALLLSLSLREEYKLSSPGGKWGPLEGTLKIPFRRGSFHTDFSYDWYDNFFSYTRYGISFDRSKWSLGINYSNYPHNQEFILVNSSFEAGEDISLSGEIGYNIKTESLEKLSYGINAKLHCLGVNLNIQEKPYFNYKVAVYVTAFPF